MPSFGLSSKAEDSDTIGKFGLGMKSVFHLCEAFFFRATSNGYRCKEVLNPWSGTTEGSVKSLHGDWDEVEDVDFRAIEEEVAIATGRIPLSSHPVNFLLWLPLRRRAHGRLIDGRTSGFIIDEFPGDETPALSFLSDSSLGSRLASLLPLLCSVRCIRVWLPATRDRGWTLQHEATLTDDAQRPSRKLSQSAASIRGVVAVAGTDSNRDVRFAGCQSHEWTSNLQRLHNHEYWPSSWVRNELGVTSRVSDPAEPHSAAVFDRVIGDDPGTLTIRWAVFLPVETGFEEVPLESAITKFRYTLTLHGYFFVDAGRQRIGGTEGGMSSSPESGPADERELRTRWNAELSEAGTLRHVIPALARFVDGTDLPDTEITALTAGIQRSTLWKRHSKVITADHAWVCRMDASGAIWTIISSRCDTLPLPSPPRTDPARPWRVFPTLDDVAGERKLIEHGAPHLLPGSVGQWNEDSLAALLRGVDVDFSFRGSGGAGYLVDFLASMSELQVKSPGVQSALIHLLRSALRVHGARGLRSISARVSALAGSIRLERRLRLQCRDDFLSEQLALENTDSLVWPAELDCRKDDGIAKLGVDDAVALLRVVEAALTAAEKADDSDACEAARHAAEGLLRNTSMAERPEAIRRVRELRVLTTYDATSGRLESVAPADLTAAASEHRLFRQQQGVTLDQRAGHARALQRTVPSARVYVVTTEIATLVFSDSGTAIPPCHGQAVLHMLASRPWPLGDIEARFTLIEKVGNPDGDLAATRGLRYLLHANPEHHWGDQPLWVEREGTEPVWRKVWSRLQRGVDREWSVLDVRLAYALPRALWTRLGIREIGPSEVLCELARSGVDFLAGVPLTESECEIVLSAEMDDALWCELPLHLTVDGELVSIRRSATFLDGGLPLDADLLSDVNLLRPSESTRIRRRQERLFKTIGPAHAQELALRAKRPDAYWRLILDTLDSQGKKVPEGDRLALLRGTAWIPLATEGAVAPQDVIDLPKIEEDVHRLVVEAGVFACPGLLNQEFREHPQYCIVRRHCFARDGTGVEQLCLLLEETNRYSIGSISSLPFDSDKFGVAVELMAGLPVEGGVRGWRLLATIRTALGNETALRICKDALMRPIAIERVCQVLGWLSDQTSLAVVRMIHGTYLSLLAAEEDARSFLAGLRLLAADGRWRPAEELCYGYEGIARSSVLDEAQARILANVLTRGKGESPSERSGFGEESSGDSRAASGVIQHYFSAWQGRGLEPLIGTFILLLGNGEGVRKQARALLSPHSVERALSRIPWPNENLRHDGTTGWLSGLGLESAIDRLRFAVGIRRDENEMVTSILGESIRVPLDEEFDSVLVGKPRYARLKGDRYEVAIALRWIDPHTETEERLSALLKRTVELLLFRVYDRRHVDLDPLWGELRATEQFDIDIARRLVLEDVPLYLRQLGAARDPDVRQLLTMIDEARHRTEEFRGTDEEAKYREKRDSALEALQTRLETDERVQDAVLASTRRRLRHYQYRVDSVPFELFTNADDALRELEEIEAYPSKPGDPDTPSIPRELRRVVVSCEDEFVALLHWGRPVNWPGKGSFPGAERGYHRDLQKMLVLSASDKQLDDDPVSSRAETGKFGLGFKSVLLACDRPVIVSGRLQSEVVGGLVPCRITDASRFRRILERESPGGAHRGTLMGLPVTGPDRDGMLDRFFRLAGVLCVFARSVREIVHVTQTGERHVFGWWPVPISKVSGLEHGSLSLPGNTHNGRLRLIRAALHEGDVLFALDSKGVCRLPSWIPSVWATGPTDEGGFLGFAVNASFDVDPGRANLSANNERNQSLATRLGESLVGVLAALYSATSGSWSVVAQELDFEDSASDYDFWDSIWSLMSESISGGSETRTLQIAKAFVRGSLGEFAKQAAIVPSGLKGGSRTLIRAVDARHVLTGALAEKRVLAALTEWSPFNARVSVANAVSPRVAKELRAVVPGLSQMPARLVSVSLETVVSWLAEGDAQVQPDDASVLGRVIAPLVESNEPLAADVTRDVKAAKETLIEVRFRSAAGTWAVAGTLLLEGGAGDEARRAGFAPAASRLSPDYDAAARRFFLFARETMTATVKQMTEWIRGADERARQAALRYLVEGERRAEVGDALRRAGISGTWFAGISENSRYLEGWEAREVDELIYRILPSVDEIRARAAGDLAPIPPPALDPGSVLPRIRDWWDEEAEQRLIDYGQRIYPNGRRPNLALRNDGSFHREDWLAVFALGSFHRMGWGTDHQHRTFLEECFQNGWWSTFAAPEPHERADEWIEVLEQFIDAQVDDLKWEWWMMRFPAIYRLARRLDDYVELFTALERTRCEVNLRKVAAPRIDPGLAGGGIDAPPLALGLGICFVIRELSRYGILRNPLLWEHAYVPTGAVRDLLGEFGESVQEDGDGTGSREIYQFLGRYLPEEEITFGGAFDIPLRTIAHDTNLQLRLLGRTVRRSDERD